MRTQEIKQLVIDSVKKYLSETIAIMKDELEFSRQEALAAPSRMESRYDSTKQEASYNAHALMDRMHKLHGDYEKIETIHIEEGTKTIDIGSLVYVLITENGESYNAFYIVLPGGEGFSIPHPEEDKQIIVVGPQTPLGSVLMGRVENEEVEFRSKKINIISIQ